MTVLTPLPAPIAGILARSTIDGRPGLGWVHDTTVDPKRRAALLNILAVCCVTPTPDAPFIADVRAVVYSRTERIYCRVRGSLLNRLRLYSEEPAAPDAHRYVFAEGHPHAPIHADMPVLVQRVTGVAIDPGTLESFRCNTSPSLQIVLPSTPAVQTYADLDLDLGNPLADVVGFAKHMAELADGGPTDHLRLRPDVIALAGDFVGWRPV